MEEGGLFPEADIDSTQLLLVNFGEKELQHTLPLAQRLRKKGIRVELYPDAVKIGRQFSYADAKGIPYVAIVGEVEIAQGRLQLKNMSDGSQTGMTEEELITKLNDLK
jgi:histidyl-tRNA synthetase